MLQRFPWLPSFGRREHIMAFIAALPGKEFSAIAQPAGGVRRAGDSVRE
jgi:hypothetical protein